MTNINGEELGQPDQFIGHVIKQGDSLCVVIPANLAKFCGIKEHELIRIWFKKTQQKTENTK